MVMLYRKMLRDVWKQKSSFLSIFLLMFMGCYIFSGITTEYHGMQTYSDSYHAESNMADAVLQGNHLSKLHDSNLDTQEVMKLSSTLQGHEDISLEVNIIKENRISKMKVMDGVNFDPSLDGVWLDERFAQAHGYQVGDSLTFLIQGQSIQKEIKGLILSVEYIYQVKDNAMTPDHEKSGFLYMNQTNLPFSFQANQLLVKSTLSDQELKNKLIQETNGKNCLITLQHDNLNYSMLQDEIDQHKELGLIFSFTFLGIAVFVSITTIHRLLHQQQLQIGILKALGFSKRTLFFHYATHCTFDTLCQGCLRNFFALFKLFCTIIQNKPLNLIGHRFLARFAEMQLDTIGCLSNPLYHNGLLCTLCGQRGSGRGGGAGVGFVAHRLSFQR